MLRWFENQIDPFVGEAVRPPDTLFAFAWYFVRQAWPAFVLLAVFGLAGSLVEISLFAFIGKLIDLMKEATSPGSFFHEHWRLLALMTFVALVLRPGFSFAHDIVKNQMLQGPFLARVRWQTHRYVLRQSLGYFQSDFAGRIANQVMQTAGALHQGVVQVIESLLYVLVHWIGTVVLFAQADRRLAVPLVLWLAAYVVVLWWFVPRIKSRSADMAEARSLLTGRIVDSYTNILTVKLFAHAAREDAYARDAIEDQLDKIKRQGRLITLMELILFVLNGVLMVGTTGLALWLWSGGQISIGAIAVVTGLVIRLINMSGWVMWVVAGIFDNIGTVQEGLKTLSKAQVVVDREDARPLVIDKGEIRYESVRFHYGRENGVIENLSLTIAPGEKVGLVGRSGAGKSTLVNLLLRFYDLEAGRIQIDGQDIALVAQDSLRAQIGMVTQDTSLLHRSVLDNILYGRPDAGEAAAIAAAKKAQAHDFIVGLEDMKGRTGYHAHVGERGVKLSGGQRQRIAIARVLLKNAPILVLDEATSALDSEVEAAIQEQLYNLMAGKTVIAIAHRLSTIAAMDRLVIMDAGRIVESGSHRVLIERGGIYADLWARQSGGFLAREAAE